MEGSLFSNQFLVLFVDCQGYYRGRYHTKEITALLFEGIFQNVCPMNLNVDPSCLPFFKK